MKKYNTPEAELMLFPADLLMLSGDESQFEGPKDYASDFSEIGTI